MPEVELPVVKWKSDGDGKYILEENYGIAYLFCEHLPKRTDPELGGEGYGRATIKISVTGYKGIVSDHLVCLQSMGDKPLCKNKKCILYVSEDP